MSQTEPHPPAADGGWQQDGAGFESVPDPARQLVDLPQPWAALEGRGRTPEDLLDVVLSLKHRVPIGDGGSLAVTEHCTLRSWLSWPKRAALFLPGTATLGSFWSIPEAGYNGTEMAARRGLFAFTADYLGVGDNYRPGSDALESTFEANLEALRTVLRYVRFFRAVDRVDLVGESWGGAHATQLAADARRVRSCVMSSVTYKTVADPRFVAPEFVAFLRSLPDNYLPNGPEFYDAITLGAPAGVAEYARTSQPGNYLTTQLWQIIDGLPHFDPGVARVPGLVISGSSEGADGRELARDYGEVGAEFFEIADGGHVPRAETPERARLYWDRVLRFLDDLS